MPGEVGGAVGRRGEGDQVLGRLAKVLVHARVAQLVIACDRGAEHLRVHAELLCQLLDGVGRYDASRLGRDLATAGRLLAGGALLAFGLAHARGIITTRSVSVLLFFAGTLDVLIWIFGDLTGLGAADVLIAGFTQALFIGTMLAETVLTTRDAFRFHPDRQEPQAPHLRHAGRPLPRRARVPFQCPKRPGRRPGCDGASSYWADPGQRRKLPKRGLCRPISMHFRKITH